MAYLSRFAGIAVAALALLTTASAGVNTPHSGWYSGNPLLGQNALRDLACAGTTCYASGDFGTLIKSTDGGTTWKGIVTGLRIDLGRVRLAAGLADQVVVGGGCSVRRSNDGGETFFRLPFTARDTGCADPVASFSFPTQNTGYFLLVSGRVLVTTDGGRTFTRRTPVPDVHGQGFDILCTAERTCLAVGLASGILRTQDGGVSWTRVGFTGRIDALVQADAQTIYGVGIFREVAKSVDGGATWGGKPNLPLASNGRAACGNARDCLFATGGTQVVRTIDGGTSYTTIVPSGDPTFAVSFAGPARAIAAGAVGSAEVSNDAGATWEAVGTRIAGSFGVLAAGSPSVAYAGGVGGVLARTRDSGQTWANVSPPTEAVVTDIAASGAERLYVLASDGTLQRSDNGGGSYRLLNPGFRPFAIAAIDPDRLVLVGQRGLARSVNGGESFEPVGNAATRGALLEAADVAAGAVLAYGPRAAVISTDQGFRWRRIGVPRKRSIAVLDFVTARIGFALDSRRSLWKTTDGGRRWRQVLGLGTGAAFAIAFSSPRAGYVAIRRTIAALRGGLVLRTTDGGQSWHPQLVSRSALQSVRALGSTDYALAVDSSLYATELGGDVGAARTLTLKARVRGRRGPRSVLVSGRLSPVAGGEEVVVSLLVGNRWTSRTLTAAANGTFGTRWRLNRNAALVAQVLGDADHRGVGTKPLLVKVR
jgi:photosystem II stability/assembly factor-like uncharacterized protein